MSNKNNLILIDGKQQEDGLNEVISGSTPNLSYNNGIL